MAENDKFTTPARVDAELHEDYDAGADLVSHLLIAGFLFLVWGFIQIAPTVWNWAFGVFSREWLALLACVIFLVLGRGLYLMREHEKLQWIYGIGEIVFALSIGWKWVVTTRSTGFIDAVAAAGVLYVVVRGYDNFHKGRNRLTGKNPNKASHSTADSA